MRARILFEFGVQEPSTTALRTPALDSKRKRFLGAYGAEQLTQFNDSRTKRHVGASFRWTGALSTTLLEPAIRAAQG